MNATANQHRTFKLHLSFIGLLVIAAVVAAVAPASAQPARLPDAAPQDGERYPVTEFTFFYTQPNLPLPAMSNLLQARVTLGQTEGGLVAYRQGLPRVRVRLADLTKLTSMPDTFYYSSAIKEIAQTLLNELNERGHEGFIVAPVPGQFNQQGEDLRGDKLTLSIAVRPVRNPVAAAVAAGEHPDGPRYPVTDVQLNYTEDADWLPPIEELYDLKVRLGDTEGGLVAPREKLDTVTMTIGQLGERRDTIFYRSALQQVMQVILEELNSRGYVGFVIQPGAGQLGEEGEDLRLPGDSILSIQIEPTGVRSARDSVTGVDGMRYPVSNIRLEYAVDRKGLPAGQELLQSEVKLGDTEDGYTSWREGMVARTVELADVPTTGDVDYLFGSAIKAISTELVEQFNQRGFVGVVVQPSEEQFSDSGLDIRPAGDDTLVFTVKPGVVTAIRTTASGDLYEGTKQDLDQHRAIRENAPVQPAADEEDAPQDVLRKADIERYVHWLNRHPGRRVDVAIAAGGAPGSYSLDFLVYQQKPWLVFAQASNTGTDQTDEWRQRFGFVHNQLTGNDDILRIDYITAGFSSMHTVLGSYEIPVPRLPRVRAKLFGSYSEYTASDINIFDENISGDSYTAGGELSWNFYQREDFFLDLFGGVRYMEVNVTNELFGAEGETGFVLPTVGVRADRIRQTDTLNASVAYEWNIDSAATDEDELANFGRTSIDEDFARVVYEVGGSFYLEPLFNQSISRTRPPVKSLVHEISLAARGQYVPGDKRIIPQLQQTAGGLYSVRGYEEAVAVGDNVFIVSGEYRFHLPRLFTPAPAKSLFGREMAWRPTNEFRRPDWDLILKAFVDYGVTSINEKLPFEENEDLLGVGVGLELQLWRNFNFSVDWATALEEVQEWDSGEDRVHFVGTILY